MAVIETTYYGRAPRFLSVTGAAGINADLARVWTISATAGPHNVTVANPRVNQHGGPGLFIFNIGAQPFNAVLTDVATVSVGAGQCLILVACILPPLTVTRWYGLLLNTNQGVASVVYRNVVVAGGAGLTTSAVAYSEIAGTWGATGAIPNAKLDAAGMSQDGGVGFMVGFDPPTVAISNKNDEVDQAGTWRNRTDCPFLTSRACTASFYMMAFGKLFSGSGTPNTAEYRRDAWISKKVVPYTKTRGSAQVVGNKAFIISGEPVPIVNLAHEPLGDTYYAIAFQPGAKRYGMGTFAIEHHVYAVGGKEDVGPTRYDLNEQYNTLTDSWATKTALSLGQRHAGLGFGANSRGYIMGGRDGGDVARATAASYQHDAWTGITSLPAPRADTQNAGVAI